MKLLSILVLSLFFSHSVFCSDSDLIEDVIVPVAPQPKIKRDFSLKSLENFIVTNGEGQETMAIAVYPLRKNENAWDNLDTFAQDLDRKFFKRLSKKVIAGGMVSACFGGIVPHPSCGYVIDNIGNFLHVPVSSTEANLLISWITITTTPVFMQQSFNIGKRIVSYITHEDVFDAPASRDDDSKPHVFKKTRGHYVAKTLLLGSAAINATIPVILMRDAERNHPIFFAVTAIPFYLAWMENYYKAGSLNIDHLFEFHRYTARSNYQKRDILKQKIMGFKKAINSNDKLVMNVYETIHTQEENGFSSEEGSPFSFSTLFLRNLARMADDEGTGLLLNFKTDVDTHPSSTSDYILEWTSSFLTGAGLYSRYAINQYVLDNLLVELGMPANSAFITSTTFSAFEALYRASTSNYIQQQYFKSLKNVVKRQGNFSLLRKGAGIASFINGSLFSLPNVVAGLKVFENYRLTSKMAYLAPSFLLDLSYYDSFFNRHYNEVITNVSSIKERNIGVTGKRSHLNYYANKAYHHINQFDSETIEKLYQIIQKGV